MTASNRSADETNGAEGEPRAGSRPATDGGTAAGTGGPVAKEWAIFVGSLFTVAGVGIGFFSILIDGIDTEISASTGNTGVWGFFSSSTTAILLAVFVGVFIAWRLEPNRDSTKTAAASMLVGTFGFVVTRVTLTSTVSDTSLAVGGLVVNALVAALVAAGVAAAGVWLAQNRAPSETAQPTVTATDVSGQTSD